MSLAITVNETTNTIGVSEYVVTEITVMPGIPGDSGLPSQTGNAGKVLGTDGTNPLWQDATAGSGTVTSLADFSPIFTVTNRTTTPVFTAVAQAKNLIYAGPSSGSNAAPIFRVLAVADIPSLSGVYLPLAGGTLSGDVTIATTKSLTFGDPTGRFVQITDEGVGMEDGQNITSVAQGAITVSTDDGTTQITGPTIDAPNCNVSTLLTFGYKGAGGSVDANGAANFSGGALVVSANGDIGSKSNTWFIQNSKGQAYFSDQVEVGTLILDGSISIGVVTVLAADKAGNLVITSQDQSVSLTIGNSAAVLDATLSMTSNRITDVTDPSQAQDAATKAYVDAVANGLLPKASCYVATTANITLSGEQTIDGVTTSASRVLVKNQSTASQNGIYTSASGSWTRATDADTGVEIWGAYTYIERGTTNATTLWANTNTTLPTLGSTNITFGQVAGPGSVTAGTGITVTANQVSITNTAVSAATYGGSTKTVALTINAQGQITAASESTFTGSTSVVTLGTVGTGVWQGSIIASTYGGTGNGFTKFSGPTTSEKTFTLPNADATILYSGGALGSPSSVGTLPAFTLGGAVTGGAQTIDNIIVTGSAFKIAALPGTDNTYQGMVITGRNAGATIAQWEVVYLDSSGTWQLADANGSSTYPARGLAVAAYSNTNAATVLYGGVARNDAWNWTIGGTVYLSTTAGALTQTAPSTSGDKVQIIGYALTADSILVTIGSGEYLTVT